MSVELHEQLLDASGFSPLHIVELGSGLSGIKDKFDITGSLPYSTITEFTSTTTPGHPGVVYFCRNGGGTYLFCGRSHLYEGVDAIDTARTVLLANEIDVETLIFCSACGSLNQDFPAGTFIISDNILQTPIGSISGSFPISNFDYNKMVHSTGTTDLNNVCRKMLDLADIKNISARAGVIGVTGGPLYETAAEIRAMKTLGVDAVTMSLTGLKWNQPTTKNRTAIIAAITNLAAGFGKKPLKHQDVLNQAETLIQHKLGGLLIEYLSEFQNVRPE